MRTTFMRKRIAVVLFIPLLDAMYSFYLEISKIPIYSTIESLIEMGWSPILHLASVLALLATIIVLFYSKIKVV